MAELKYQLAKRLDEEALEMGADRYVTEVAYGQTEDAASAAVNFHLPEERLRIAELLSAFPEARETKVQKLLDGLGTLWRQNPDEKIVVFATYLGTVDLLGREIEGNLPRAGRRGASRGRSRGKDGCRTPLPVKAGTARPDLHGGPAGKASIFNFARVLFNFDLPWNPMDVEQRIGRIHRYGQRHTAQVYNLVLSDTIEGRIFLLLDDKLTEIARTLGKVDAQGNVAEDLRSQILGQLAERLNYHRLYQEALDDPELKRTSVELETALANAREAREVVFDLFQDLDGFSLDDYKPFSDVSSSLEHLVDFMAGALAQREIRLTRIDDQTLQVVNARDAQRRTFTLDRDTATTNDEIDLLGLDHPLVQEELHRWGNLPPEDLGIAVRGNGAGPAVLTLWRVEATNGAGERRTTVQPIAVRRDGTRAPSLERQLDGVMRGEPDKPTLDAKQRLELFSKAVEPTLQRELKHKGSATGDGKLRRGPNRVPGTQLSGRETGPDGLNVHIWTS